MDNETAKRQLDKVINRARVHFYKPIQIAEILHRDRIEGDIDLNDLDSYRASSKKWRDEISLRFVGNISTSSSRFQDNLFEANATPPEVLVHLGITNKNRNGVVIEFPSTTSDFTGFFKDRGYDRLTNINF